jgi:outer membrane protein
VAINWAALRPELDLQAKAYQRDNNAPSGTSGGSTQSSGQGPATGSLAFTLTQRIYDWGLTNNLIDVSRAQYAIRNAAVDMAEQQLVANVIGSYYQFSAALGQTRIRQDELALAEAVFSQAQLRFKVGTVPRLDVVRAEARVEQARGDLVASLAALGDVAASFYAWLGVEDKRYVPAIITVPLIEIGDAPPPVDMVAKTAVETRPEVQMQCATLMAGKASIGLASNHPVLQAYANGTLQHPAGQSGTAFSEYGLQLNWTLFNGGKDSASRKQAKLEYKALSEGMLNLEAQIELDATKSWDRLYSARASVRSARKSLELTAEALRIASVGYSAGVITYTDYRDALDANITAALAYLGSLIEVRLAQVDLERAQGFPAGYAGDTRANRGGSGAAQESASTDGQAQPAAAETEGSHEQ